MRFLSSEHRHVSPSSYLHQTVFGTIDSVYGEPINEALWQDGIYGLGVSVYVFLGRWGGLWLESLEGRLVLLLCCCVEVVGVSSPLRETRNRSLWTQSHYRPMKCHYEPLARPKGAFRQIYHSERINYSTNSKKYHRCNHFHYSHVINSGELQDCNWNCNCNVM